GSAMINVVRDLSPPYLDVAAPRDGAVIDAASITVSGLVNDIVNGTVGAAQATVTVAGLPAAVSNRSFLAAAVPLSPGPNFIEVIATDASGNVARKSLTITRQTATAPRIAIVSGDLQSAAIGRPLAQPLVAGLFDAAGAPVAGRIVLFQIDGNDGTLLGGKRLIAATTDAAGRAATPF